MQLHEQPNTQISSPELDLCGVYEGSAGHSSQTQYQHRMNVKNNLEKRNNNKGKIMK